MNPVFYHHGGPMYDDNTHPEPAGWYFMTETWADYVGPFDSEEQANTELTAYAHTL